MPEKNAPADQMYWGDWLRKTRMLSPAAKGAWADFLATTWFSWPRGWFKGDIAAFARMWGTTADHAEALIREILRYRVGSLGTEMDGVKDFVDWCEGDALTDGHGNVTLVNRRKFRQWKEQEGSNNRKRKQRDRDREGDGGEMSRDCHANVTALSSSSSSSSSSKKENNNNKGSLFLPFEITDEMLEWAARVTPNVKIKVEHARFAAYYSTGKGKNRRSEDWPTGWQLWMLNAENRAIPKVDRLSPCSWCDSRRRIVGLSGSNPCPECRPQEYSAWLKGRDV